MGASVTVTAPLMTRLAPSRIANNKSQEGYCIPSDLVESSGVRYTTSWRRFLDDSGRAYACFGATSESSLIPTLPLQLAHGNNSSTWPSVEQAELFWDTRIALDSRSVHDASMSLEKLLGPGDIASRATSPDRRGRYGRWRAGSVFG